MSPQFIVTALVLLPLLAAILGGLVCITRKSGTRGGDLLAMSVTTGSLVIACALAWMTFFNVIWGGWGPHFVAHVAPFIQVGDFKSDWSVRIDTLSAVMLIVVTTVSALVHIYSWGYMAEDPSKARFFSYLSFFTFAMLALVTANDFMQLFFGWEGVGVASYLLIGFWYHKPTANAAAIKAFVVNRVGDFGFALGIMTVFWMFHTIRFPELFPLIAAKANTGWDFAGQNWKALDLAGFLLFIGAMGKSAQFFLHTWLPDAMEGPTPVSALIHAATMVTAGVYMVCLLSPLYEYAPIAKNIIALIGAVTCLFAATVGLSQNDIKRVIAYSTCSQLGYMFFAAGVGAYQAAMFHLFTHAFFKALLFLGAGSVIHGMHHEQDMRRYGHLAKFLPVTYAAMTIGTIAITGLGIPGVELGFAGFYSKDTIIHAAWVAGQNNPIAYFTFIIGVLVAGMTAYYSWRLAFFTFNGHARWDNVLDAHGADDHASHAQLETHSEPDLNAEAGGHREHLDAQETVDGHETGHGHAVPAHGAAAHAAHGAHGDHGHDHKPHESPWVMLLPLVVLSIGAVFAGWAFEKWFVGEEQHQFWKGAIFTATNNTVLGPHEAPEWVVLAPLVMSVIGLLVAAYVYLWKEGLGARLAANAGPLYTFFYNKWYFDELYDAVFVKGAKFLGDLFWKGGDQKIIDGLGPNGVAAVSYLGGKGLGRIQTGYVYHYAFVMLLGVAGLLTWVLFGMR